MDSDDEKSIAHAEDTDYEDDETIASQDYNDDDSDIEVVLKERKQNVKLVRELGGKMSSITCQKKRQPKIDNETTIEDPELVMIYRGNKYICV